MGRCSSISKQSPGYVRLVLMSDTHGRHPDVSTLPAHDVLIHCGDSELSTETLNSYAASLPSTSAFVIVCGNMDRPHVFQQRVQNSSNVVYLQDRMENVCGLNIYGSPWTPEFVGAFQITSGDHAHKVWAPLQDVREHVDILVTHGPPKGVLDVTSMGQSVGDETLRDIVMNENENENGNIRLHCFGHIHASYGTTVRNNVLFVNAAIYRHRNKAVVVDFPLDRSLQPIVVPWEQSHGGAGTHC